ncbi:MAG: DUF2892 domain-containing protein [Candidatus Kapaibacterium sp.]
MKKNVGKNDLILRFVIGLSIGVCSLLFDSLWGLLGILPIASGLIGYCPFYAIFGFNTCELNNSI